MIHLLQFVFVTGKRNQVFFQVRNDAGNSEQLVFMHLQVLLVQCIMLTGMARLVSRPFIKLFGPYFFYWLV
jgi:hypothetical protein